MRNRTYFSRLLSWLMRTLVVGLSGASAVRAEEAAGKFFDDSVRPILQANCWKCHGAEKQRGDLRLDSLEAVLRGGESGPAVVPHSPDKGTLMEAVRHGENVQMPPGKKLADADIAILRTWIEKGAPWSGATSAAKFKTGDTKAAAWALKPLTAPKVPAVRDESWPLGDIDRFLLAELEKSKLTPAAAADRLTLLRRVTFDLIGLPPTRGEVEAYLADDRPDAYERVVDRLLASPHYGEHWGRRWLDLACYAETNRTKNKPNAYRYRDYVIRAFNVDLPYDKFLIEQIAGDQLAEPRRDELGRSESLLGTAFLYMREMPEKVCNASDVEVNRSDYVADQIDVLGKALLGLTVSCARCHNHKFDPVKQDDFYALAGFLRSSKMVQMPIAVCEDATKRAALEARIDACRREAKLLRFREAKFEAAINSLDAVLLAAATIPADVSADRFALVAKERNLDADALKRWHGTFNEPGSSQDPVLGPWVILSKAASIPAARVKLRERASAPKSPWNPRMVAALTRDGLDTPAALATACKSTIHEAFAAWAAGSSSADDADHRALLDALLRKRSPLAAGISDDVLPDVSRKQLFAVRAEEMRLIDEVKSFALTAADAECEDAHLQLRGNCKNLGPAVPRRFVAALCTEPPPTEMRGSGRLYLARQFVDARNPLTPRVFVNRCWHHLFGRGIVATPDNFGVVGEPPSHPELLDHLAADFVTHGWSTKHLIRTIVLTRAYRMSSTPSPEALAADPTNRLLQHTSARRLSAEELRDSMLAAAELLDRELFGPSVRSASRQGPVDGNRRRSIYLEVRRGDIVPMLLAFDFPNPTATLGRRHVSFVPAQSLVLMNNEFVHTVANNWGLRLAETKTVPAEERIDAIFRSAVGRPATAGERTACVRFLEDENAAWGDLVHAVFESDAFLFVR